MIDIDQYIKIYIFTIFRFDTQTNRATLERQSFYYQISYLFNEFPISVFGWNRSKTMYMNQMDE